MNLSDNAILVADDLSEPECTLLERTATPAATLLWIGTSTPIVLQLTRQLS